MVLRKLQKSGQAALEYMLILTVVAVVVFLAIKPAGSPTVLNRAQSAAEGYYNTVAEVIMGKNPQPVNGGWCPPKPNGERECACPQPAFGGAPCAAPDPSIIYCGDGICNGCETGEPGDPCTCFEDCDYLPDCGQCGTLIPSAGCGEACGAATCSIGEVCMTSDCPPGCAGFTQSCQPNAALCSGSCFCNPGSWVEVSGCGIPSGTCTPTWLEKCFSNGNCNAACTPAQTTRAISDPACGSCPATPYAIGCGPGTVTIPATPRGSWGSVTCPFGCTTQDMRAFCANDGSGFGLPENICIPAVCLATAYNTGVCGSVNFPITSPGGSTPPVTCPPRCTGTVTGVCPSGTATFSVLGSCIPNNCNAMVLSTVFCGPVNIPPINHGDTVTLPCPAGCSGSGVNATCDREQVTITESCFQDCIPQLLSSGACGMVSFPSVAHGSSATLACPGVCTGTISATCTNASLGVTSNSCQQDCLDLLIPTPCGNALMPGAVSGNSSSATCPVGCTGGPLTATCANGSFGPISGTCLADCTDLSVPTACGNVIIPGTTSGNSSSANCLFGCAGGPITATCTNGVWGPVSGGCAASICAPMNIPTVCGNATLPGVISGDPSSVPCPAGCTGGPLTATCVNGSFGPISGTCLADCPDLSVPSICGNVIIPGTTSGSSSSAGCLFGCSGGPISATCINGAWGPVSGACAPNNCNSMIFSTLYCGPANIPPINHGDTVTLPCPGGCSGGGIFASCDREVVSFIESCSQDCVPQLLSTGACGLVPIPLIAHGSSATVACPGACTGTISASCSNATINVMSNNCLGPCGASTCYSCSGTSCVVDNAAGIYSDPACLGACGTIY